MEYTGYIAVYYCWIVRLGQIFEKSQSLYRQTHSVRPWMLLPKQDVEVSLEIPQLGDFLKDFDGWQI